MLTHRTAKDLAEHALQVLSDNDDILEAARQDVNDYVGTDEEVELILFFDYLLEINAPHTTYMDLEDAAIAFKAIDLVETGRWP